MTILALFFTLHSLATPSSQAALGKDVIHTNTPSTCRILFRHASQKPAAICSGVLTQPDTVMTSAFCALGQAALMEKTQEKLNVTVECGYQGGYFPTFSNEVISNDEIHFPYKATTSTPLNFPTGEQLFSERRGVVKFEVDQDYNPQIPGTDVGRITLDSPILSITPVPAPLNSAQVELFAGSKGTRRCHAEGFGIHAHGYHEFDTGTLQQVPVTQLSLNQTTRSLEQISSAEVVGWGAQDTALLEKIAYAIQVGTNDPRIHFGLLALLRNYDIEMNSLLDGDQGGPLYCEWNGHVYTFGVYSTDLLSLPVTDDGLIEEIQFSQFWAVPTLTKWMTADEFMVKNAAALKKLEADKKIANEKAMKARKQTAAEEKKKAKAAEKIKACTPTKSDPSMPKKGQTNNSCGVLIAP